MRTFVNSLQFHKLQYLDLLSYFFTIMYLESNIVACLQGHLIWKYLDSNSDCISCHLCHLELGVGAFKLQRQLHSVSSVFNAL